MSTRYSENGKGVSGDIAVVVVGEKPYAEMEGDKKDLKLAKEDLAVIARFTDKNIPVVVVLLSGRPMIVTDEIDKWNGFVAAWLPGTEGSGVADVLFGDYNPTGKLSFSWPKNMDQFPINPEDPVTKVFISILFHLHYQIIIFIQLGLFAYFSYKA